MDDDKLKSALDRWEAPEPPKGLADRVWARLEQRRRPLLIRALVRRVDLPLSVVAAAGLILVVLGAVLGSAFRPRGEPATSTQSYAVHVTTVREKDLPQTGPTIGGFRPLPEIRPQVIRRN